MRTSSFRSLCRALPLVCASFGAGAAAAQGIDPVAMAGGGPNLLLAAGPGLDVRSGASHYVGLRVSLGGRSGAVSLRPTLQYAWARYRTRLTDLVDHRANRGALQLDLLAALRAGAHGLWVAGPFAGAVMASSYVLVERGSAQGPSGVGGSSPESTSLQAGVVLGYTVQLGTSGKWDLDLRLRQHLLPLVRHDHRLTIPNGPNELLLDTRARPLELTLGLGRHLS